MCRVNKEEKMNKAVIIGGTSGIGLAVAVNLIKQGYFVHILGRNEPNTLSTNTYEFHKLDLTDYDYSIIERLATDGSVEILFISAGIGKVAEFGDLHISEIERTLQINTMATIKIIRQFYHKLHAPTKFYCGIMGSIAGMVNSPLFAVYAASKAAVFRFCESINAELSAKGFDNRILNVAPGSIKGTGFSGGQTDLAELEGLAAEIVGRMQASEELFIPQYDEIYRAVLARYAENPQEFGLDSYKYKLESGRISSAKPIIGYLSGTFDLFHIGHLNLIKRAKAECDYLIVGVHLDGRHKDKDVFIPFEERVTIIQAIGYVDEVIEACSEDSETWEKCRYDRLFVGSDYRGSERFARYEGFFEGKGVQIVFFPYTLDTSSSQIRELVSGSLGGVDRDR